jgi:hypothetical protein
VQVPSLHTPPVPQSEFAQHPDAVVQVPMQSDCPVGQVHVPVRQVWPPVQSLVAQQLDPGMHPEWQLLVPVGHRHVLAASHASPPPQLALAQHGSPSVPHVPDDASDASVATSLAESLPAASWPAAVSAAPSVIAASVADASLQSGAHACSWIPSRPTRVPHPPAPRSAHASMATGDARATLEG